MVIKSKAPFYSVEPSRQGRGGAGGGCESVAKHAFALVHDCTSNFSSGKRRRQNHASSHQNRYNRDHNENTVNTSQYWLQQRHTANHRLKQIPRLCWQCRVYKSQYSYGSNRLRQPHEVLTLYSRCINSPVNSEMKVARACERNLTLTLSGIKSAVRATKNTKQQNSLKCYFGQFSVHACMGK